MEVRGWAEGLTKRGRSGTGVLHRLEFWHGTGTTTVTCKPALPFSTTIVAEPKGSDLRICGACRRVASVEARRIAAAQERMSA